MSKTLAATILGVFILLSAVVIAVPESAPMIGGMVLNVIKWACIVIVAIIAIVLVLLGLMWKYE